MPESEYVEYGSLATVPGPLATRGSTQWGFVLEVDPDRLEALCVKVFAGPTRGAVDLRPLGRHVLLTLGRIRRIVSEMPPYHEMGYSPEGQCAIWVPVGRVRSDGDRLVAEELLMFTPYMWVDNPLSLPSGREMYGFPKSFGWGRLPAPDDPDPASLELDVFGMDFGRDEPPTRHPLLRLERGERAHEGLAELAFEGLIDIARHFRRVVERAPGEAVRPGLHLAETLARDVRAGGLRQVFLKQVRSVADGSSAALQQVTEIGYRVTRMKGHALEHEYRLTVEQLDSHPLTSEIGLGDQATRLGFRAESDFVLEAGRVIWDAGDSP